MIMKRTNFWTLCGRRGGCAARGLLFALSRRGGIRDPTTSMYGFSGYDRVTASQTFRVHVVPDLSYSVQVTCDTNIVPYLVIRQSGSGIELGLQQGYNYIGVTATAVIHMPALSGAGLCRGRPRRLWTPGSPPPIHLA